MRPAVILDILANYTLFATDKKKRRLKIVCRYQQFEAANRIVERVVAGRPKKGLIWHFQGSGKSLLMVFAAQKMRMEPQLKNPTVLIVVDRIDLDAQMSSTFHASDIPNLVKAESREELERLLKQDTRKIIITTIFKFAEADGVLNERENIIVLVDEAHRTQEGDLGMKMRRSLPNAFLLGFTGTPINRRDRNTFYQDLFPEVRTFEYFKYLHLGLISDIKRKTLPAIAKVVGLENAEGLDHFLTESPWSAEELKIRRLKLILNLVNGEEIVVIINEKGDKKKGKTTDYVKRQYIGNLGKIENRIVAVTAYRLFRRMTFHLIAEVYKPRERLKEGDDHKSKPKIGGEIIEKLREMGFKIKLVLADNE
jgi:hypothetical protein